MTPKTLRRKLQKKLKRKPHIVCTLCGRRLRGFIYWDVPTGYSLLYASQDKDAEGKPFCKVRKKWSGGEMVDAHSERSSGE